MKKILSIAMIFLMVLSTFSMFVISGGSEIDNAHRRVVIVDNSGNSETLTDYQVFINVTYCSEMQPDFDDLRFTWYDEAADLEIDIDYWLDKYDDSEYALVWVEVPSIRALGEEILYMYYGDPDAISESNGEETFVFFDGFSTDTTSNYELWSPLFPLPSSGNPNEFSWDPNGWLFVNASERETSGRCSNVHVTHKTAMINAVAEKYWLETRGKAFGTGILDYFGVGKAYKHEPVPDDNYELFCLVRSKPQIQSLWGTSWEFRESGSISTGKDEWYRFGVGTSKSGTVIGRFNDDDYNEIETIVSQTIHQDNEWWVDLLASRGRTEDATLYAYFDYVRVRKFTDPEPSYAIIPEEVFLAKKYFPVYRFSAGEQWYPCSFYFDKNPDVTDNTINYGDPMFTDPQTGYPSYYAYVHIVEDETYLEIQYWLYYVYNYHRAPLVMEHDHDWDSVIFINFLKSDLTPVTVRMSQHLFTWSYSWSGLEKKDETHLVAYVAEGSHGVYRSAWKADRGFDKWESGGLEIDVDYFNWYIVGDFIEHSEEWVDGELKTFCSLEIQWVEGTEQQEPIRNWYWPHEWPSWYEEIFGLESPWHRPQWKEVQTGTLPRRFG